MAKSTKPEISSDLNLKSLQDVLWESITKIRNDEASAANVNAISNASGKILSSLKVAMEYARLTGKTPNIPLLLGDGGEAQGGKQA